MHKVLDESEFAEQRARKLDIEDFLRCVAVLVLCLLLFVKIRFAVVLYGGDLIVTRMAGCCIHLTNQISISRNILRRCGGGVVPTDFGFCFAGI